jgi:hypothetical protein
LRSHQHGWENRRSVAVAATISSIKAEVADIGKLIAIGKPSIATLAGEVRLSFVYAVIRGLDPITGIADLDFQAGFVTRPAIAPDPLTN